MQVQSHLRLCQAEAIPAAAPCGFATKGAAGVAPPADEVAEHQVQPDQLTPIM